MDCSKALPAFAVAMLALGVCTPCCAVAQELPLRRDVPQTAAPSCDALRSAVRADGTQDPDEAVRLAAAARESALLGELRTARDLLARAVVKDTASAEMAFLFARALDDLDEHAAAARAYCRYLDLSPGAADAAEVRQIVARMPPASVIADSTLSRFREALARADARRDVDADSLFSLVIAAAPSWPVPWLDRAVVRARVGAMSAARSDVERFLTLAPDDPDAVTARAWLAQTVVPAPAYSAATAFAVGLLPGAGHFYTKRPIAGTALLVLAGGAAAFGALYQERHVDCLSVPVNGACPRDQVRGERTERPYLLAAAGAAGVITVLGAIDAARGARNRNARATSSLGAAPFDASVPDAARLVRVRGDRVDVALLRVRF